MNASGIRVLVQEHVERFFQGHTIEYLTWNRGPIKDVLPLFCVARWERLVQNLTFGPTSPSVQREPFILRRAAWSSSSSRHGERTVLSNFWRWLLTDTRMIRGVNGTRCQLASLGLITLHAIPSSFLRLIHLVSTWRFVAWMTDIFTFCGCFRSPNPNVSLSSNMAWMP